MICDTHEPPKTGSAGAATVASTELPGVADTDAPAAATQATHKKPSPWKKKTKQMHGGHNNSHLHGAHKSRLSNYGHLPSVGMFIHIPKVVFFFAVFKKVAFNACCTRAVKIEVKSKTCT